MVPMKNLPMIRFFSKFSGDRCFEPLLLFMIIRWRNGHILQSIKNHETCAVHLNN